MKPVFICGHIKTGTSLLASLLDDHPQLSVFPEELFLFSKFSQLKKQKKPDYDQFWDLFFNDVQIKKLFNAKAQGLYGNVDYSEFDAELFKKLCLKSSVNKNLVKNDMVEIFEIILRSFNKVCNTEHKNIWVEKTPMNELNFFFWKKAYPKAQFLYLNRNPFDVYASIKKKRNLEKKEYSIINFVKNYLTSAKVAENLQKKYPGHFKIIELEKLQNNTESTVIEISKYLGIDFNPSLLKPSKFGKPWFGNSMFNKNDTRLVFKNNSKYESHKFIDLKEKNMINKYVICSKNPIFDIKLIGHSLRTYFKLVFLDLRVFLFIKKLIGI
jgi:hypothetical protein